MRLFLIASAMLCILSILIIRTVKRVKKGEEKQVREYYAFRTVSLLTAMAASAIAAVQSSYSFWDFLVDFLQIRESESEQLTALRLVLVVIIFCVCAVCVCQVLKVYKNWDGPISERQFWRESKEMEQSSLLLDFIAVAREILERKSSLQLQVHQFLEEKDFFQESDITNELTWQIEFARIYMLLSNQADIDLKKDWHSQEHCYISSYAGEHWIGILCAETIPDREEVEQFLTYIHRLHSEYLHIVIGVKNDKRPNETVTVGELSVEYIFKDAALKQLADFSGYYRAVDELYHRTLMESSSLTIEDIYVEPECRLESDGSRHILWEYVQQWLGENSRRQLALLGDFGQGKTLFSIRLAYKMIQHKAKRIPILIFLRNKSPRNSTSTEILSYFSVQYGIRAEALDILNRNGKLLLIFDGFDEMDLVGNDDIRKLHFRSLWSLAVPGAKMLITGRPNYFLSPDEMRSALGMQAVTRELPYCEGLELQLFDEKQILLALRSSKQSVQDGIKKVLENGASKSFQDLIRRPSLLFYVSQMWEERELEKKYHNLSSAVVIHEFLQHCFERQAAKGSEKPFYFLAPVEREYFMIGVAAKMYKAGEISIDRDEFQNTISQLIDMFPDAISRKNPIYLNLRNGKSVREFAGEDLNSRLAIMNDVRSCGVLVNDYINDGLTFAHKSFYDLLTAKFFMGKELRLHDDAMKISDSLSKVSAYNPRLKNDHVVRKLLAELISSRIVAHMGADNGRTSRKIFEQCIRAFFVLPFRPGPDKLLYACREGKTVRFSNGRDRKKRGEVFRFRLIFMLVPVALLIYLFRLIWLTWQLGSQADAYFVGFAGMAAEIAGIENPVGTQILFLGLISLLGVSWIVSFIRERMKEMERRRAGLVLFTWFYACMDNRIPINTAISIFSPSARQEFLKYMKKNGGFSEKL